MLKPKLLITCLFLFVFSLLDAQKAIVDSLCAELKAATHDTTRVKIHLALCEYCETVDNIRYAEPGIALINKMLKSDDHRSTNLLQQKREFLSYIKIYYQEFNMEASPQMLDVCTKMLHVDDVLSDIVRGSEDIDGIIEYYLQKHSIVACMDFLFDRLKKFEKDGALKKVAFTYNSISYVYSRIGNQKKALEYQLRDIEISEKLKDEILPWKIINAGMICEMQNDYDRALGYLLTGYKTVKKDINEMQYVKLIFHIAECYRHKKDFEKAINYKHQCIEIGERKQDTILLGQALSSTAIVYRDMSDFKNALTYALKGYKILENFGSNALVGPTINLADIYTDLKQFDQALKFNLIALGLVEKAGDRYQQRTLHRKIAQLFNLKGEKEKYRSHLLRYYIINDSISASESVEKLVFKEMNYENEKNEFARAAEREKEQLAAAEEKKKQNIILISVCSFLTLVILFSFIVYRQLSSKKKANLALAQMNETITAQKHLVEEKQKEIIDSITYARRIQRSLLPTETYMKKSFERLSKKS